MALQSIKIMRIWCPRCGYHKDYDPNDLEVSLPSICPACNDGEGWVWTKESKEKECKPEDDYRWGRA